MIFKKLFSLLTVFLFLSVIFSISFISNVKAEEIEQRDHLIDIFFIKFFKWAHKSMIGNVIFSPFSTSWKAFRFTEPPVFVSKPDTVYIE